MLARRRLFMVIFIVLTLLPAFLLSHQTGMTTQTASPIAIEAIPVTEATPSASEAQPAWLELGPEGALTARAITDTSCPEIVIDDVTYARDVRAEPSAGHPVTVCETSVPPGSASVLVGGRSLTVPSGDPQRILVIGDTG